MTDVSEDEMGKGPSLSKLLANIGPSKKAPAKKAPTKPPVPPPQTVTRPEEVHVSPSSCRSPSSRPDSCTTFLSRPNMSEQRKKRRRTESEGEDKDDTVEDPGSADPLGTKAQD